jgi:hypothetical protein
VRQMMKKPGTQLTMRTFHTGGVAGADITHGLPRVVELFEARKPKGLAKIAEVWGVVSIEETDKALTVVVTDEGGDETGDGLSCVDRAGRQPARSVLCSADERSASLRRAWAEGRIRSTASAGLSLPIRRALRTQVVARIASTNRWRSESTIRPPLGLPPFAVDPGNAVPA